MSGGSGDSSRSDPKRRLVEDVEGLLDCDSSDAVLLEQRLNALRVESCATVEVEE